MKARLGKALLVSALSLTAAALCVASPAAAQEMEPGFWRSVREPGYARAMQLTRQGLFLFRVFEQKRRLREAGTREQTAILEGAIERFALAHRRMPTEPLILYLYASATSNWESPTPRGEERMDDEALTLFRDLRSLDPSFESMRVAFSIAIIHTRAQRFAEAADEYRHAIARAIEPDAIQWSNMAEVTMLAGDVEEAVRLYERSIQIADETATEKILPLWGLAVALDRLGEHRRALEIAGEALSADHGEMAALHHPDVFFEPEHEIYWYEGLAHAAMAARADSAESRRQNEALSRESFRRYLAEGGSESQWADLARRHVETTAGSPAQPPRPRLSGGRQAAPSR